ncbi:uncharacterized protein [Procambarus clarkii]|uniref:uncharacterized protein isoform X5 n=1 Tax=Procambarus clarkii TaxID=6728 RepID=UPI003741FD6E
MDARHVAAPHTTTPPPKPLVFVKMEALVREMQDPETGVPIRSQKLFLTSIPSAFMASQSLVTSVATPQCVPRSEQTSVFKGYDLIEWLLERLEIEDSAEAIHLANLLCQYGYFFPVGESRSLIVKDDSSLYRFQTPYYWPSQNHSADTTDYAIYLTKRLSRNKQKHGLEDYEVDAYNKLKKALSHKWDFISMQAEEQVKLAKDRKKGDKIVTDSQERAYWRVYRPPPGFTNCLETAPVPDKTNMANRVRKKTVDDLKKDNFFLASAVDRTRQKVSQVAESLLTHAETYFEYDHFLTFPQPSNPWLSDDLTYWTLNDSIVDVPTEKRVRRWAISMEELINDTMGQTEFTAYLRKEFSHENIRFWQAVNELRWGPAASVADNVRNIFEFFSFGGAGKKKVSTPAAANNIAVAQTPQPLKRHGSDEQAVALAGLAPHGSTGSVGDTAGTATHQGGPSGSSNKLDCDPPYSCSERQSITAVEVSQSDSVCPWDTTSEASAANICPWETSAPPPTRTQQPVVKPTQQRLTYSKARPDRSKSVDVSSLSKRHGSVCVAPSLVPVLTEGHPTASICPWESQELPNRTTEKSKSIDVDVCPWETSEPPKKPSTSSAPGMITTDTVNPLITPLQVHPEHCDASYKVATSTGPPVISRDWGSKDGSRPPCERNISIQICPWEEVVEEESGERVSESTSTPSPRVRRPSEESEGKVDQAIKPKDKYLSMNIASICSESYTKLDSVAMQTVLDPRPGISSEGTSSPSSTCSSSSQSDSRRIKIDYTVRSGHLPGQYGLPIISSAASVTSLSQQTQHGHVGTTLSSGDTSTTSSSSSTGGHHPSESPRVTLPCPTEGGSKPASPKVASSLVAPWEDNPPQKMTDICPWEDEESCKMDTPFVKTYATLGYL